MKRKAITFEERIEKYRRQDERKQKLSKIKLFPESTYKIYLPQAVHVFEPSKKFYYFVNSLGFQLGCDTQENSLKFPDIQDEKKQIITFYEHKHQQPWATPENHFDYESKVRSFLESHTDFKEIMRADDYIHVKGQYFLEEQPYFTYKCPFCVSKHTKYGQIAKRSKPVFHVHSPYPGHRVVHCVDREDFFRNEFYHRTVVLPRWTAQEREKMTGKTVNK